MAKTAKRKLKASPQPNARMSAALAARKEFKREIALQRQVSHLMRQLRRAVLDTDANMRDFLIWLSARHEDITGVYEPPSSPQGESPIERMTNDGSVGTGRDRNVG